MSRRARVGRKKATRPPSPAVLAYSIPAAASAIGIGTTKLNELIASGELPSFTIGRRRLVHADDLASFVLDRRRAASKRV